MSITDASTRGAWSTKLGFILAAAGSAVGLGNIWRFPTEVASNGGAAFLVVYLICCFLIGFPVMMAELSIGRHTRKNPVGAFKALSSKPVYALIGAWGVLCGVMILSYYIVIAGWTVSYFFEQIFFSMGMQEWATYIADLGNGPMNALFAVLFMAVTISIVVGGISDGIERATKFMMPLLIFILIILIGYVLTQPGSTEGLKEYLQPDFSQITPGLIFAAMGQAFFSLSLGMGALITYGSYLNKKENITEAAAYVTLADVGIAFLAGLLIMPAMYMAQAQGVAIFNDSGELIAGVGLIFQVLPQLFHTLGGTLGLVFGASFFFLLSVAALTSTISLLEVPVSYAIDEQGIPRKKAASMIGIGILLISLIISFNTSFIDIIDMIFSQIGLPLGGIMICLFLGYVWKTENAMTEIESGHPNIKSSLLGKTWRFLIMIVCPLAILYNLISNLI
ncbi:MAG: sodium-dependent transporter [Balneolaceae bacterium]|nr:sodium-dependent transporter [Balneolaceae bacterium]